MTSLGFFLLPSNLVDISIEQIHPKTFAGDLPHSPEYNNVAVNKANLTHCYAKVVDFLLSVECGQDEELLPIAPDLQEIAQSDSLTDLIRLLKHLPLAAFKNKTRKTHYLQDVIELASSTQGVMMNILSESGLDLPADTEESEGLDKSDDSSSVSDIDAGDLGRAGSLARANNPHSELEKEERFAKVLAENERITQEKRYAQKQLHTLHDKHVALQQNHDATQDQLNDTKDRLDALLAGTGRVNASRNVDSKHDALIADMEQKTSELEQDNESLRRELAILSVKAEKLQRLQDECDVLKDENGKLVRKAATADKYKQKIEASQGFQKENEALKVKVVELQKQVKESDSTSAATSELRRENQEYRDILSTIEQDRNEQSEMRKRTELEYHTLRAQHEELSKQSARQQAGIEELQGRLQDHEEDSPTTPKLTTDGLPLTYYDPQFLEDEAKISEGLTTLDIEEQNYISEAELRAIMTAMQAQARNSGTSNKASDIAEDKKLAEKLERGRHTTKQLIQVIDFLAQPRFELIGVKDLDSTRPFKPSLHSIDADVASVYASANASVASLAPSSKGSLALSAAASKRSSDASSHIPTIPKNARGGGRFNIFRRHG